MKMPKLKYVYFAVLFFGFSFLLQSQTKSLLFDSNLHKDQLVNQGVEFEGDEFLFQEETFIKFASALKLDTYTINFWFYSNDLLSANATLLNISDQLWIKTTTQRNIQFTMPLKFDKDVTDLFLAQKTWYNFTFSYNKGEVKIYLNDAQMFEDKVKVKEIKPLEITFGKNNWREFFKGKMQNIKVYNKVLPKNKLKEIYQATKPKLNIEEGVLLYVPFDTKRHFSKNQRELNFNQTEFLKEEGGESFINFKGKGSFVDFGKLDLDNVMSLSLWVKPKSVNREALVSFGHAYDLRIMNGKLLFTIPQVKDIRIKSSEIKLNEWQHIVCTFHEQQELKVYVDGRLIETVKIDKGQNAEKIGRLGNNLWNDFYEGEMKNFLVWDRILTGDEVSHIYRLKTKELEKFEISSVQTSSLVYWLMGGIMLSMIVLLVVFKTRKQPLVSNAPSVEIVEDSFLVLANKVVHDNLADSAFNVDLFAKQMNLSKTGLYNRLKEKAKKSPKEFIRSKRLLRAEELLRENELNITEIIFATGFESRAYFNKCFREKHQMTPSTFRLKNKIT